MHTPACRKCGAPLREGAGAILRVRFPDDLLACYALAAQGPGAVVCPRCTHINVLPLPTLLAVSAGDAGNAIFGTPDPDPDATPTPGAKAVRAASALAKRELGQALVVTHGRAQFRRAFIEGVLAPAVQRLNEFILSEQRLDWITEHEDELDQAFFCALWLGSSGAIMVFTAPTSASPPASFVPAAEAPARAAHLRERKSAEQEIASELGELIGFLLVRWARRTLEQRSLQPFIERAPTLLPRVVLSEEVLAATATCLGTVIDGVEPGARGAIAWRYTLDALLALLCAAHGVANPRRRQWSGSALYYDFMRRRDGNSEALLLAPELMVPTIDQPAFWAMFKTIGEGIGLDHLTRENAEDLTRLAESAGRLFPDEMLAQLRFAIRPSGAEAGAGVVAASMGLIADALGPPLKLELLEAAVNGVRQDHPDDLVALAEALVHELDGRAALGPRERSAVLRSLIQTLNETGHPHEAGAIGDVLEALLAQAQAALSDGERATVLNELGNCKRYAGRYAEALALYEQALALTGTDIGDAMARVALRNRAIILRELHRYSAAQAAFAALIPHASPSECRALLTSQAACLLEMGLGREALALLEAQLAQVEGVAASARGVVEFSTVLAFLWTQHGQFDKGMEVLENLVEPASRQGHHLARVAYDCALLMRWTDGGAPDHGRAAALASIASLHRVLARISPVRPMDSITLTAVRMLDRAMLAAGDAQRAEVLLKSLCEKASPALSPRAWILFLLAAGHAGRRGDAQAARHAIEDALRYFQAGLWNASAADDVLSFTAPHAEDAIELVRQALACFGGQRETGALARHAADIRAAPVLTSRLRVALGLAAPLEDLDAEEARLRRLLGDTPAILLQFVGLGEDVAVLRSRLDERGELETQLRSLGMRQDQLEKTVRCLAFALERANPLQGALELGAVPGWDTLAARSAACLDGLPAGLPLVVAAGPVQEVALALALQGAGALCFVPSLAALVALRERRLQGGALAPWQPAQLFSFAAWFDRERPEEARALAGVPQMAATAAERHGVRHDGAAGLAATRARLADGLAGSDLAWIACHGRIEARAEAVDLYVAAGTALPPADLSVINRDLRDEHIVKWQALAALPSSPRVVLSSACSSGLNITNRGGERLGLERPLFAGGTQVFVAPLWPVPTRAIQPLVAQLLERLMAEPAAPLAAHAWKVRAGSLAAGTPGLAAQALAVFGDAL